MDKQTKIKLSSKFFIFKRTLVIFFPLFIFFSAIIIFLYLTESEKNRVIIQKRNINNLALLEKLIKADLNLVISDLMYLTAQHETKKIFNEDLSDKTSALKDYILFLEQRGIYDQIRFLDITGMEILRINYKNGIAKHVPKHKLQFKGNRYYSIEANNLFENEIYVSPLDLNMEKGKIEHPLKPVIRFAAPIFSNAGQKQGAVIVNYLAETLLKRLDEIPDIDNSSNEDDIMLLNKKGYWLQNSDPQKEWGFMLKERKQKKLQHRFYREWEKISLNEHGQFITDNGLFSFVTIYPNINAKGDSYYIIKDSDDYWKLVSHVPVDIFYSKPEKYLSMLIFVYVPVIILIAFGSLMLSSAYYKRKLAEIYLKKQNISYSRFVPKEFISLLNRKKYTDVKLSDSVQKNITILFSDIRSYTKISENLRPEEIFFFLNEYFKNINPSVIIHKGFIDKFIGDAIMVLFPESPEHALLAAIEMKSRLKAYNEERVRSGLIPVKSGFGLHYGEVTLGTVGTPERMDTTVIGDTVNLTSRLETATKVFKADIILSDSVYKKLDHPDSYCLRQIDTVRVKGKQEPVIIYESFDTDEPDTIDKKKQSLPIFNQALSYYREGIFEESLKLFKQCSELCPEDSIPLIYLTRCSTMLRIPPGANWSGVSTL